MNWEQLQNVIKATDAQYASGDDAAKQAAVAARENAVNQYQNFLSTYTAPAPSSGGGGGGESYAPPPAPPPPPPPPPSPTTFSVKQPSPSLVQYDSQTLPQELIEDLLYEQVGGQELISLARHDTVNGQDVSYSVIKNLSVLNQNFNPNNILAGQSVYKLSQLGEYALDIANKLPYNDAQYPNGAVYLDSEGNLVIEFTSIGSDEFAEAEISTNGTIYRLGDV